MPDDETKTAQVAIRMTPTLRAELETLAKEDRRKFAGYCAMVLEMHVEAEKAKRGKKR